MQTIVHAARQHRAGARARRGRSGRLLRARRASAPRRQGAGRRPRALLAWATIRRSSAIGESGLDYYYEHSPKDVQARVFRVHIEAARQSGLPLVVHTRDADRDTIEILEEEMAAGPLQRRDPLLQLEPGAGVARARARPLPRHRRHPHVQALGRAARDGARAAARAPAARDRRALSRARAVSRQAQRARLRRPRRRTARRGPRPAGRRDRAGDQRELLPAVRQGAGARRRPHEGDRARLRHLERGADDRLPLPGLHLGRPARPAPPLRDPDRPGHDAHPGRHAARPALPAARRRRRSRSMRSSTPTPMPTTSTASTTCARSIS